MFLISILHNKILISVDFEPKKFDQKLSENRKNRPKFFGSESTEIKILLCKMDIRNKLYEIKIFDLCIKKMELMKQIHLFRKGFVIFLKGSTFSDFIETSLWNYKHLAIQIRFPLFWRVFFQSSSERFTSWYWVYYM